jgi:hypothetical protein
MSESSLNIIFRKKLNKLKLTENTYDFHYVRHPNSFELSILYYRCQNYKFNCKSRYMILFDKKNELANIYQNNEIHNHQDTNSLNQNNLRKHKMNVILTWNIYFRLINNCFFFI